MDRAGAVVVLGGGPSLTPADVEYARGRARVIAIKEAVRLAPWADVLYFCDWYWYELNKAVIHAFQGLVATIEDAPGQPGNKARLQQQLTSLRVYRNTGSDGLCETPDGLRTGHNSGYQAINLAYHLGAKLIVLLGIDMKAAPNGRMHWFEREHEYKASLYQELMLPKFKTLLAPLAAAGVRVVNCSPDSALDCFERVPLREALA